MSTRNLRRFAPAALMIFAKRCSSSSVRTSHWPVTGRARRHYHPYSGNGTLHTVYECDIAAYLAAGMVINKYMCYNYNNYTRNTPFQQNIIK